MSDNPTWPKIITVILAVSAVHAGGITTALSWHASTPRHQHAADKEVVDRVYKLLSSRLDRIETRQEKILDKINDLHKREP